jgi:CheY-like chemotaxis protein
MPRTLKKILLVEDNADVRQLPALFMKRLGYEVYEAGTGLEAVDRAATPRPDLIIMDFCLPGITGIEATRRLKFNPSTKDIPVLIITGFSDIDKRRALVAGAADILRKPIDMTTFRGLLRRYLSAKTKSRRSRHKR